MSVPSAPPPAPSVPATPPPSRSRRVPWREIALLLVVTALCLGAAEAGLRRFHPVGLQIYEPHPRWLYHLIPGARKLFIHTPSNGARRVLVTVDREGFRGPDLLPAGARPRVVVYGDSFVEGEFSPVEETFVARLAAEITRREGAPVEVVNAGVVAYGPDQELRRMEDELPVLRPRVVVVAIFTGNDFGDPVRDKLFRLDAKGALVDNAFTIAPRLRKEFAEGLSWRHRFVLLNGLRNLWTLATARPAVPEPGAAEWYERVLARRRQEYVEFVVDGNDEVTRLFNDNFDADVALKPTSRSAAYKRELLEQILARMKRTCDANHAALVVVVIPTAYDVCRKTCPYAIDAAVYPEYRRDGSSAAVMAMLDRQGIAGVDLFPEIAAHGAESLYFVDDDHWNAAGQELAARVVAGRLPRVSSIPEAP